MKSKGIETKMQANTSRKGAGVLSRLICFPTARLPTCLGLSFFSAFTSATKSPNHFWSLLRLKSRTSKRRLDSLPRSRGTVSSGTISWHKGSNLWSATRSRRSDGIMEQGERGLQYEDVSNAQGPRPQNEVHQTAISIWHPQTDLDLDWLLLTVHTELP